MNDNLYEWYVRLHRVDPDSPLARDMAEQSVSHILLNLIFPDNFPFAPPFMRVVEPRIEKGFVMDGGAICMELLTPRGWASAYTVEAVLMQFSASLVKGQGRIAKSTKSGSKEFSRWVDILFRYLLIMRLTWASEMERGHILQGASYLICIESGGLNNVFLVFHVHLLVSCVDG